MLKLEDSSLSHLHDVVVRHANQYKIEAPLPRVVVLQRGELFCYMLDPTRIAKSLPYHTGAHLHHEPILGHDEREIHLPNLISAPAYFHRPLRKA